MPGQAGRGVHMMRFTMTVTLADGTQVTAEDDLQFMRVALVVVASVLEGLKAGEKVAIERAGMSE